jgi:predicted DNA-binding transcriptional regulator AlpA
VVAIRSVREPQHNDPSERVARRRQRDLERFHSLPDDALIDVWVVSAVRGRSPASTWRDVAQGRLAPPVRVGARSTRFVVGNIRASLRGGE